MFSYKVIALGDTSPDELERQLNNLGVDGWELKASTKLHWTSYGQSSERDYPLTENVLIFQKSHV